MDTPNLDLDYVRSQFPAFSQPSLEGWAFFENAGGSYPCAPVVNRLTDFYTQTKVQPYYPYPASIKAGQAMDESYVRLAAMMGVDPDEVDFGPSTSQNTYVLAHALGAAMAPGDEVVVTNQDHEANTGVWRRLASDETVVKEWKVDPETAELHPMDLEALLTSRTRAVAFTHCSNLVGSINPVREITDLIHEAGAWAIVDGVSFCPHGMPDVAALGADIYLFSLYKVYGPHLGAMYISKQLNAELPYQGHFFNALIPAARFTPAGPDHAQIATVNGVIDYMESVYSHHQDGEAPVQEKAAAVRDMFRAQETALLQPFLDFMSAHPKIRLIGKPRAIGRAPTVAFSVEGQSSMALAEKLGGLGLGVGAGHFYAYRLVETLGYDTDDGVLRASFVHYTTPEEIEQLINALDKEL